LINKLCNQKLVKRFEDQEDRRLVMITLTDVGKTLLEQAKSERRNKLKNILSYLSDKEKSEFQSILKNLYNRLQNNEN
jgi:MarR family transcriptional regulator, organic hydroperoxide resistance regulator